MSEKCDAAFSEFWQVSPADDEIEEVSRSEAANIFRHGYEQAARDAAAVCRVRASHDVKSIAITNEADKCGMQIEFVLLGKVQ